MSSRFVEEMHKFVERKARNTMPELGTVISADPLVISLELDPTVQLDYTKQDFTISDTLFLQAGDRVVLMEVSGHHRYHIFDRIRGNRQSGHGSLTSAVIGDPNTALGVARIGDTVSVNLGTGIGTITSGSTKVQVS